MKHYQFISVLLLTICSSCQPGKAVDFKKNIDLQEEKINRIILKQGSLETEKLQCLVKKDFKGSSNNTGIAC